MRVYARMMSPCHCSRLRSAARKVGSIYDEALAPLGVNIAQYSLMRTIARRQPVSFTELGHFAQLDRSTVSRNVRVLDRLGLVEKIGRAPSELPSLMRISYAAFCLN